MAGRGTDAPTPGSQGISHLALTVSDPDASAEWYGRVLGAQRIGEVDYARSGQRMVVLSIGGSTVGLSSLPGGDAAPFDERRIGLDHLSFAVTGRDALGAWRERLEGLGVNPGEIVDEGPGGFVMVVRDPDGIQLELHAPA